MHAFALSPATLVSVAIALSFAAGLNVYATVFSLGLMSRLHWLALPGGLESLANPWVIGASGLLFAGEFVADKIPGFDVIWNVAHTFVRIPVAALMAYAVSAHLSPELHALVTCAGIAAASIAHGSKTAARIAVTPSPEPVSNITLSSGEDVIAILLTWLAANHPAIALGAAAALTVAGIVAVWFSWRIIRSLIRGGWRSLFAPPKGSVAA